MANSFQEIYLEFILGVGLIPTHIIFCFALIMILGKKKKLWQNIIEYFVLLLAIFLITLILYTVVELPYTKSFITYIGFPPLLLEVGYIIYTLIFDKRDLNYQITVGSILYCMFYSIISFCGWLGTCQEYEWLLDTDFDFTLWSSIIMMCGASLILYHFNFRKYKYLPKDTWVLSLVLFVFNVTNFTTIRMGVAPILKDNRHIILVLYGAYLVLSLFVYLLFYYSAKEYNEKLEAQANFRDHKNDEQVMRIAQENYDSMRKLRHDIKNQYAMMSLLLQEKKYDELNSYFQEYTNEFRNVLHYTNCGNKVVDNLINLEKMKATEKHVTIKTTIAVPPVLPFANTDLCSLVTNLLDNAIEAVEELEEEKRVIEVLFTVQESYLFLQVVNPFKKSIDSSLTTTKNDHVNHGYGIKIIKNIAKKYKGSCDISMQNHYFSITVMLAME